MKVLQIMPEFGLAGAEIMCENLVYGLLDKGVETVVVSLYDYDSAITERMRNRGIRIISLGKKSGLDLSIYKKLINVFKLEKPDVIHTHRYVMQYAIPCAVLCRVPICVHTVHNIATKEQEPGKRKLAFVFYHLFGVIPVALSNEVKKTICAEYKMKQNEVPVILNGEDLSKFVKKDNYKKENALNILHIGRFMDAKNHECIIEAVIELLSEGFRLDINFVGNYDSNIGASCKKRVDESGYSKYIHFAGLQSDVRPFLAEADIFILPSKYEGVPMTLIEAMASGMPIIAADVGGIPDMISNEESGLLIAPEKKELEKAIIRLYDDENLRRQLGENAYKRSMEFDNRNMAERYIAVYTYL